MKKILLLIEVVLLSLSTVTFSADTISKYQRDVYYTEKGRLVFPPQITVDIDSSDSLLKINIPYLYSLYNRGSNFVFPTLYSLPINIEKINSPLSDEEKQYMNSDEYLSLVTEIDVHPDLCDSIALNDILDGLYLNKWGYQYIQSKRSLTIIPKAGSLLDTIKVPALDIADFSFNSLLKNEVIKSIMQNNKVKPPIGMPYLSSEMRQIWDKTFPFVFEGGSLLDYLICACETCMENHEDYIIAFQYFSTNASQFVIPRFVNKYDTLVRFSEYNE